MKMRGVQTIAAADAVLERANGNSKIIPGHGPLSGIDDLKASRSMLIDIRDNVVAMMKAGKSNAEIIAAKPSSKYDEKMGGGFIKPKVLANLVHEGLKRQAHD